MFVTAEPLARLNTTLSFLTEDQSSKEKVTDFSLIYPSRAFRDNPPIAEGTLRSLRLDVRLGDKPTPLDLVASNSLEFSVEHSQPSLIASDFTFSRFYTVATVSVPTIGENFLFRPNLRLRFSGGASVGTLPPQRCSILSRA